VIALKSGLSRADTRARGLRRGAETWSTCDADDFVLLDAPLREVARGSCVQREGFAHVSGRIVVAVVPAVLSYSVAVA
jgi:hypothetical protein